MEKQAAAAAAAAAPPQRILRFLPKAASAINFHSLTFSPVEVRRQPKNERFETQEEPTSPKISCMGQIKHKKKMNKATYKRVSVPQEAKPASQTQRQPAIPDRAPSLSHMKRFASGRDTLASFDWTAHQIAPVEPDGRDCYSDEERRDSFEDQEDIEEVIIPFSAPMVLGGGGDLLPRKEVNLWKRRTMDPPKPLQLKSSMVREN
ncbi:hypothetical protein OIU84_013856 [Salix udensis]|uniref:Syringolide-induced protein 14-1-1 n=1 Tax=Salix udensis TaxID=889485 RepID=A0AAD6NUK2_9ROSI|nr:hypothetical protein OIU84_013856 [Salix udensis]